MVHFWNFKNHKIPHLWNTWRCVGFRLGFLGPSIHNLSRFIYFSMTILQISFSRRFSLYLTSSSDADDPFIIGFFLSFLVWLLYYCFRWFLKLIALWCQRFVYHRRVFLFFFTFTTSLSLSDDSWMSRIISLFDDSGSFSFALWNRMNKAKLGILLFSYV